MIINIENLKSFTSTSLEVNSGADCITIYNSHIITDKDDMKRILVEIANKTQNKEFAIHQRTMNSMLEEWTSHNLLYKLCLDKAAKIKFRLQHTDLELNQTLLHRIAYSILGKLYFLIY